MTTIKKSPAASLKRKLTGSNLSFLTVELLWWAGKYSELWQKVGKVQPIMATLFKV
jgi:hypothetical protein